jgi:para-aminobenzoate synthetase component 1
MRPTLLRYPLGRWVEPADAFVALYADRTDIAWLDSATAGGRSYLAASSRTISSNDVDVLGYLRADLAANRLDASDSSAADSGFSLGWIGWIGYETRFATMGVPRTREAVTPDAAFLWVDRALEFDHEAREVRLIALGSYWNSDLLAWRDDVVRLLGDFRIPESPGLPMPARRRPATWRDTDAEYLAMIRACKTAIAAGEAYQLCLTTLASIATGPDATPDPVATYLALRASSPSHHGALLRIGDVSLLSSSPEQFLSVSPGGTVESRPIKGTRPRGATPEEDAVLAAELLASEKERAENLMIVDLMRNDISRVSRIGSVEVPSLLAVESYAQVHQLVSTVRGQLEAGLVGMDAVVACFPAGSMTGAPKSSATRILDELEGHPRGIYAGAFGYFGLDGRIDLAMVIRSIVLTPEGATVGAGGGITALSDPDQELAEVKLKAAVLLRVLGSD